MVQQLAESGVNAVLLSVDAFHQETIPLETVKIFAGAVKEAEIPIRTHPAWLGNPGAENEYNSCASQSLYSKEEDIRSICIGPDGDVLSGNVYRSDIMEIIDGYVPTLTKE